MKILSNKIPHAENFSYGEMIQSETAFQLGINNIPDEIKWKNLENLVINILQPVRNQFGSIRILSGYRSLELNRSIGNSDTSNHILGEAVDFEPVDMNISLISIIEWMEKNLQYKELIAEFFPTGWIHCAYSVNNNKKILKLKDKTHNYSIISIASIKAIYS